LDRYDDLDNGTQRSDRADGRGWFGHWKIKKASCNVGWQDGKSFVLLYNLYISYTSNFMSYILFFNLLF